MKKAFHIFDFMDICPSLSGIELTLLGVPHVSSSGIIREESIDQALAAIERDSTLHIASFDRLRRGYNFYKTGLWQYFLCRGDADPEITVDPSKKSNLVISEEDLKHFDNIIREIWANCENNPRWIQITKGKPWNPGS